MRYTYEPRNPAKAVRVRGSDIRVHYKNTYEVCQAIKGMGLKAAQTYLEDVMEHKQVVPFRKFCGGVGRTAQAKAFKATQGRWPTKSCKVVLGLLRQAEANADYKGVDAENMTLTHVQVNEAQRGRRRTYRAHGRIGPYMNSPANIEFVFEQDDETVEKPAESTRIVKFTKKQFAKRRLHIGN
ncbi:60S ribosomal protein L17 [Perkinsus olseni]|uniref:60S ribosomal protein L17 n=1 Tax=Perkinsus olseni TaxID=32597 RepID=A0A7J6M2F2_PEROL|nr:60S ribosomal protein L17 [Perkinsus olseni]KAF4671724.1 60S ribosomal protein L17 [Perkinsus olseni]